MDTTLRKAAILVDTLDIETANILLDRMGKAEADRIRAASMQLDIVSEAERRQVVREFQISGCPSGGVEYDPSPALRLLPDDPPDELASVADGSTTPFEFLQDAEAASLARHLAEEDSHKVAVVLCHLPPLRSAEILKQLPDTKRIDVVIRMSGITELAQENVGDIECELREVLSKQNSNTGFDAVLSIMESVDTWSRSEIIGQLKTHHRELAEQLTQSIDRQGAPLPESLESNGTTIAESTSENVETSGDTTEGYQFEDLVQLDSDSFATLIQEADPDEVLLALTGATPWMVDRLLDQLPSREEKRLRQKMDRSGPLTLKDIEVAQQKLIQLTSRLAVEGKISPPARRPFTSLV